MGSAFGGKGVCLEEGRGGGGLHGGCGQHEGFYIEGQTPPHPRYVQPSVGTHPTGMHPCTDAVIIGNYTKAIPTP